jgi:hypothetical protein
LGFHLGFTIYFESGRLILYSGMFWVKTWNQILVASICIVLNA